MARWREDQNPDESSRSSRIKHRQKNSRAKQPFVWLPAEEANATVAAVHPSLCSVRLDEDRSAKKSKPWLLCKYRRQKLMKGARSERIERAPVAVGDRVHVSLMSEKEGLVDGLCQRINRLVRMAPGRDGKVEHVIASNLDALVIVSSARQPDFSPGLVDRYLIAAQREGVPPYLVVNKIDLLEPSDGEHPWTLYRNLGIEVLEVSAKSESGIDDLVELFKGKQAVFSGHSGVGKTTLLNRMTGGEAGAQGEVNQVTGKGKHTTTGAILLEARGDSAWIDTPGIRSFGLLDLEPEDLVNYFPEIAEAIEDEVDEDQLALFPRYSSFLRIKESLEEGEF